MTTTEAADKIRRIVSKEEKPYEEPISWGGHLLPEDHWKNIANAAGAVFGVTLEED